MTRVVTKVVLSVVLGENPVPTGTIWTARAPAADDRLQAGTRVELLDQHCHYHAATIQAVHADPDGWHYTVRIQA